MTERTHTAKSKAAPLPASKSSPPPVVRHATAAGGHALDTRTQSQMSARFGHDFSQVRIHTDTQASESAQALSAKAYTTGQDIVFGPGRYLPGSPEGDRLIAHELTHVVQQAQHGPGDQDHLSQREDASEQEAEALASQVVAGQEVQAMASPQAAFARDGMGLDYLANPDLGQNLPSASDIGGGISSLGGMAGAGISGVGGFLGDTVTQAGRNAGGNISNIGGMMGGGVSGAAGMLGGGIQSLGGLFGSGSVGEGIGNVAGGAVSQIGGLLGGGISGEAADIGSAVSGGEASLGSAVSGEASMLGQGVSSAASSVGGLVSGLGDIDPTSLLM